MTTTFTVSNETQLNTAIRAIDATGADAATNTAYTIDITGQIDLTSDLLAINLDSGSSVTIEGTNGSSGPAVQTIDGNSTQRGFFDYAGTVTLENLTIANAVAQGGAGVEGGGGGAGLGGGLFVASNGAVTLQNVSFSNDAANGGGGGGKSLLEGGGGGLGGAGGAGNGGGGGGIGIGASGGVDRGAAGGGGDHPRRGGRRRRNHH